MKTSETIETINAAWKTEQILQVEPVDWPEGTELVVKPIPASVEKIRLDEVQWREYMTCAGNEQWP